MKAIALPDLQYLKECFVLDAASPSYLKWQSDRPLNHFKTLNGYKIWKARFSNQFISNESADHKYFIAKIKNTNGLFRNLKIHRIVYALYHNTIDFENKYIDHINCNGKDNNPLNLRLVDQSQNCLNSRIHKDNKTGYKNICFIHNQYRVRIVMHGKEIYIGSYKTLDEAIEVRDKKVKEITGEFFRS